LVEYGFPLRLFAHVQRVGTGTASVPNGDACGRFGGGMLKIGTANVSAFLGKQQRSGGTNP